jgi:hypothetical protein
VSFCLDFDILWCLRRAQVVFGILIFSEMKGRCLTLAKRRFYLKWAISQTFESIVLGAFKTLPWNVFLYSCLSLVKVKCLTFISPKLGVTTPLEQSLHIVKCQNKAKTPYQTMNFLKNTFKEKFVNISSQNTSFRILSLLGPLCKLPTHSWLNLGHANNEGWWMTSSLH